MIGQRQCGKCAWFHDYDDKTRRGECRVNPPVARITEGGGVFAPRRADWPIILASDWCARFASRAKVQ